MPKEVGQAVLTWGTKDFTSYGICENLEKKAGGDKDQIKDGDNDTVGLVFSDLNTGVTVEFTPLSGTTIPDDLTTLIGGELALADQTIIIDDVTLKYTKGKASTFSISGTDYPNLA